jgi:plastocyanin
VSRSGRVVRLGIAIGLAAAGALLSSAGLAVAADEPERTIVIKDHRFDPTVVEVPAGERVKLVIDNRDATPEEFESTDLRREKVVLGNSKGIVWVGPLPKGEYGFYGEFHQSTAQGKLIAK